MQRSVGVLGEIRGMGWDPGEDPLGRGFAPTVTSEGIEGGAWGADL